MKIRELYPPEEQYCRSGRHEWQVSKLFFYSEKLPVMDIPIDHLYVYYKYDTLSLRDMVMHFNTATKADLSFPIILDEDGEVLDGRHRIMKAMMNGEKTIKAVRFDENPPPCRVLED